jgi:glycosyltransferase involved in cell wall biosynthesis
MKNVWIFNHYATKPDEPATRAYDFGKELVKKGHKVTIFASSFSHYKFKEKYLNSREKWRVEEFNGVRFVWIRTFPYKKNDWRRVLNMLSYAWRVLLISRKFDEKPEIIIGTCVHPFAVLSAYLVSKNKKSRFFFEVTDLWPQNLIDMGKFKKSHPVVSLLALVEKFLFRKAEKIIIIPPGIRSYIENLGVDKEKIIWIPNGVDLSRYKDIKPYNGGRGEKIVFMYSGIHSKYASLEIILKAAQKLQKEGVNNLRFVLVGDGSEKPGLIKTAQEMQLNNVEFWDMVPKSEVYKVLNQADVFISIIKDVVGMAGVSSNKLNDYLASGRPIIFAVNSKNNPVKDARAGITIPPENSEALVLVVKKMVSLKPEERVRMGRNGIEYAKKYIDIKILAEKFEKLLM